jgi:inhibitor of cysteine peptidase
MKKALISGLVLVIMLPLLVTGCQEEPVGEPTVQPTPSNTPASNSGEGAVTIEISTDEFAAQNHIVKDIELKYPGSLIVSLGANPTTGFRWDEEAAIAMLLKGEMVLEQVSHTYIEPEEGDEPIMGAPGKDVWVFDTKATGPTTVKFTYSRPWEGGEKGEWTLRLDVTVK